MFGQSLVGPADDGGVNATMESPPTWRLRSARLAPFAGVTIACLPLSWLPPRAPGSTLVLVAAWTCLGGVGVLGVAVPWFRLPPILRLSVVALFCVGVTLLRETGGGAAGGYTALLVLPIFWEAVYGRRSDLVATIAMVTCTLVSPILSGDPAYPATSWRSVLIPLLAFTATGTVVHTLVGRVRASETLLAELTRRLESLAHCDDLTGLANRRSWNEHLESALAQRAEEGGALTMALIDLDHFKRYNDAHGHIGGDDLLRRLAAAWRADLEPHQVLARWGGEEFALLLPGSTTCDGQRILARLRRHTPDGQTFSAGLAAAEDRDAAGLLQAADSAMYRAKEQGRDRIVVAASARSVSANRPGPDRARWRDAGAWAPQTLV